MSDYNAKLKAMRIRKGQCPECGEVYCGCSSKTAGLLTEKEVLAAAARYREQNPEQWQRDVDNFHTGLKRMLKQADVNPAIRASGEDAAVNGNDVQTPLMRNPYEGDPQQAMNFENGYQDAQSLGHLILANAQPEQLASWSKREPAWRDGFAQAARGMGCGALASQLDAEAKIATITSGESPMETLATEYFEKVAGLQHLSRSINDVAIPAAMSGPAGLAYAPGISAGLNSRELSPEERRKAQTSGPGFGSRLLAGAGTNLAQLAGGLGGAYLGHEAGGALGDLVGGEAGSLIGGDTGHDVGSSIGHEFGEIGGTAAGAGVGALGAGAATAYGLGRLHGGRRADAAKTACLALEFFAQV